MSNPMHNENFTYLYPRLTGIITAMRVYDGNPAPLGYIKEVLKKKFGSEKMVDDAIDFLKRELKVAVGKINGMYHIALIPEDAPKCMRIWMQMYDSYFEEVMGNFKKTPNK